MAVDQPGLTYVISPAEILNLPLARRDVYTMILTLPGVTSDAANGRGIGLSVNGQRSTSSSFLLDGVENNDYLAGGLFTPIAPEAVGEYRVATSNFPVEFGRTTGYVANAVTGSARTSFHGLAYSYGAHEILAANDFERNRADLPRARLRETYTGYSMGRSPQSAWWLRARPAGSHAASATLQQRTSR